MLPPAATLQRPRRGVKGEGGEGEREKGKGKTYEREGWECTWADSSCAPCFTACTAATATSQEILQQ